MSEHEHAEPEWDLVMPFVVCASNGGPYDDASFVAGYELGILDARLAAAVHHRLTPPEVVVHRASLPQVDLIAMKHGMVANEGWVADHELPEATTDEWARVTFAWVSQP